MIKKVTTVIFLIGAILLAIKGKALLEKRKEEVQNQPTPKQMQIAIRLAKAHRGTLYEKERVLATISADKSIKLSTKLAGYIEKMYVEESDRVKKGDLLVHIDSKELKNSINSLKKALTAQQKDYQVAKTIYQTNKALYKAGGLPKEKLDLSLVALKAKEANLNSTREKLKSLQNQLSYLSIKAPFDGTIDNLFLHEGDLAVTGKPILSMSTDSKKLIFTSSNFNIKPNQKVLFNNEIIGEISNIYNTAKNGLLTAEAVIHKPINLPINSSINIEIILKEKSGCILPDTTILHTKEGNFIMVYSDKKFTPIKVDILIEDKNQVLITPCPKIPVANASEAKLSSLPALKNVKVIGENNE